MLLVVGITIAIVFFTLHALRKYVLKGQLSVLASVGFSVMIFVGVFLLQLFVTDMVVGFGPATLKGNISEPSAMKYSLMSAAISVYFAWRLFRPGAYATMISAQATRSASSPTGVATGNANHSTLPLASQQCDDRQSGQVTAEFAGRASGVMRGGRTTIGATANSHSIEHPLRPTTAGAECLPDTGGILPRAVRRIRQTPMAIAALATIVVAVALAVSFWRQEPRTFEDCVLERMRGQNESLLPVAYRACAGLARAGTPEATRALPVRKGLFDDVLGAEPKYRPAP